MSLLKLATRTDLPDVFSELESWDRHLHRLMSPWLRGFSRADGGEGVFFSPAIDVTRDDEAVVVKADLPGVTKDDVELTVYEDTLTIKGVRKTETERKEGRYHYSERRHGEFLRTVQLPDAIDPMRVRAEFRDGVLEIHLPIADEARPRKIDIAVK